MSKSVRFVLEFVKTLIAVDCIFHFLIYCNNRYVGRQDVLAFGQEREAGGDGVPDGRC